MSVARFGFGLVLGLLVRMIIVTPTPVLLTNYLVHFVTVIGSNHIFLALFDIHLNLRTPVRLIEIPRLCRFHSHILVS